MNKITDAVRSLAARARRLVPRGQFATMAALLLIALALGGAYYFEAHRSASSFSSLFAQYMELLTENDTAVFLPGAPNNPVRGELNRVLTQVLSAQTSVSDRLRYARRGIELVDQSEEQLAAISDSGDRMDALIAQMQVQTAGGFALSDTEHQIISILKERSSTVSDIRAYSYRADFETRKIFDRVIGEQGRLTDSFILELNSDIPDVERQFNSRTDLYHELLAIDAKIRDLSASLQ